MYTITTINTLGKHGGELCEIALCRTIFWNKRKIKELSFFCLSPLYGCNIFISNSSINMSINWLFLHFTFNTHIHFTWFVPAFLRWLYLYSSCYVCKSDYKCKLYAPAATVLNVLFKILQQYLALFLFFDLLAFFSANAWIPTAPYRFNKFLEFQSEQIVRYVFTCTRCDMNELSSKHIAIQQQQQQKQPICIHAHAHNTHTRIHNTTPHILTIFRKSS